MKELLSKFRLRSDGPASTSYYQPQPASYRPAASTYGDDANDGDMAAAASVFSKY